MIPTNQNGEQKVQALPKWTIPVFVIVGLLISYYTYIPWVQKQYELSQYIDEKPSFFKVENFEKTVNASEKPDIYSLYFLAQAQKDYRRQAQFEQTIQKIDKIIPHYRNLDYWFAINAYMKQDIENTLLYLKRSQESDLYYVPAIELSLELALKLNQKELFFEQFKLLNIYTFAINNLGSASQIKNLRIERASISEMLDLKESDGTLSFIWNEKIISDFFNLAKAYRFNKLWTVSEIEHFYQFLLREFGKIDYFKIKIKPAYKDAENEINNSINYYFSLDAKSQYESQKLKQKHQQALQNAHPSSYKALMKIQSEERSITLAPMNEKKQELAFALIQKTNWDIFLKRRAFALKMIDSIKIIVFPPNRMEKNN